MAEPTLNFSNLDPNSFRAAAREWLESNCPPSMRTPSRDDEVVWGGTKGTFKSPEAKIWLERMAALGWTVPTWPRVYGGGGLSGEQALILDEEMRHLGCRAPLYGHGLSMLGPVLLDVGRETQKGAHLPRIARGEIRWAQGYSEPEAGSDLANVRMRAELKGDHYLVNGHKIWTSYADYCDWIFCLVRVDPAASKHEGIGFLLIDLASPGIRVAPIRLINGGSQFCEVFFEDVRVPAENLVGEPNQGWSIAKKLLEYERKSLEGFSDRHRQRVGLSLRDIARERVGHADGRLSDAVLRDNIAAYEIDDAAFQLTRRRLAEETAANGQPGPVSAMMKYYAAELNKRRLELAVAAAGSYAFGWEGEGEGFSALELRLTRDWLRSKANSIEGGSAEINLNIIAKRVLGLPD